MRPTAVIVGVSALMGTGDLRAQPLTIYQIQSETVDGDATSHAGTVVDCAGGVVVGKFRGYRPRIIIQDPAYPHEWGGIQVKDWIYESGTGEWALFDNVEIGDWVSLTNVLVEEFVGNTMLQYQVYYDPGFVIESQGNPLPDPVLVNVADVLHPLDHDATERYEGMVVTLHDVHVGQMDLGKADDNYELVQGGHVAWGTDYMNVDAGAPYDPRIETGVNLSRITGVLEQYTSGQWDYYQLCTRSAADVVVLPIPTVSSWGAAAICLLLLIGGTIALQGRDGPAARAYAA
jgi:hypothetical protein